MTDIPEPAVTITASFTDYLAREAQRDRQRSELLPANKAAIFDALAAAGIATVVVAFDGAGDSGQIDSVDARDATGEIALPEVTVEIASPSYPDDGVQRQTLPLADAIETIAYDLLGATHCGWENNDGAYGDFTFDVAERTITLDYNERYTASEYSQHVF